ncbi:MAG: LysR family transcriptional regulator, partial [Hyphomicrobiales bacterium]|nr:LysR family transcriptional regulator [Hyphomicrobiales bacterium]
KTPHDLRDHACIRYRFPSGAIFNWEFERNGETLTVDVDGPITLDGQELMIEAALQGCGLAYIWDHRARPYLANGALIGCLDDWCPVYDSLYLYYPSGRHVSAGMRALIDMLKATR